MSYRTRYAAATLVASVMAVGQAQAGGFYIQEQSAAGVGRAQAGDDVAADDASTVFFNPAGMALLQGVQFTVGVDVIVPHAQLTDRGSTTQSTGAYLANPASFGRSVPGGSNGGNPGSTTPVPDAYLTVPIPNTGLTAGIGITAPFGFVAKYTPDSFARYDSLESLVQTADIAPSLAWKINSAFSIGAGLDEQYVHAKLVTALPNPLNPGGPSVATDGALNLQGHTWSTGFNVGFIIQPSSDTKIGATYRSAITHNINGVAAFTGLTGPLAANNGAIPATTTLDLPDIVTGGISQKVGDKLTLLGEIDYYGWSKFKDIDIHLATGSPDLITQENYRNTWSGAAGLEYQLTEPLKLRAGVKYDETPTVDGYRDTRVPDGNRIWLATGLNYRLNSRMSIDASYAHIFVQNTQINVARSFYAGAPFPIPTAAQVVAQSNVKFDILTAGLNYKF